MTYNDVYADWQYEVANGDTVLGLYEWSLLYLPKAPESPYTPRPLG